MKLCILPENKSVSDGKAKGKQTNKHAALCGWSHTAQIISIFSYSLSKLLVSSPWPRPSPGLAAGTKPLLCMAVLGSKPERTLSHFHRGYDWGRSGKLRLVGKWGGWVFVVGGWMTDRVCVGTMPWSACPPLKRASTVQICNSDLTLPGLRWERRINGWHKAGHRWWQMSFPFWFLTPFFPPNLAKKKAKLPTSPPFCVLHLQPVLCCCIATLASNKKEKKTKFRAPFHIGGQ